MAFVPRMITDLLVACAFPSVVAASAKRAKTPNGFADRQLLFEHMSALSMDLVLEHAANKARRVAGKDHAEPMDPSGPCLEKER